MGKEVQFQNKWIEKAVRQCLGKQEGAVTEEEMAQIQYLRVGESQENDFLIQMSISCPPDPFVDTDGGDEWFSCCLWGEELQRFLLEEGLESTQLSVFGFPHTEWSYAREDSARENWEQFKGTVTEQRYYESMDDEKEWEAWYDRTAASFCQDISLFTGLRVLRVIGGSFPDFEMLEPLEELMTAEFVETSFADDTGIENLAWLKQLCCWMD